MTKARGPSLKKWFENCGSRPPHHKLDVLRRGINAGLLDAQDEDGLTALMLSALSEWTKGVDVLLRAGANTELRHFRTGATALYLAMVELDESEPMAIRLAKGGAEPDAPNYWGITPRTWASRGSLRCFDRIPKKRKSLPHPLIQNAEHLADHYWPRFKIPSREERESMQVGQAVALRVYGPESKKKQNFVKVRIKARKGNGAGVRYTADVETPPHETHWTEPSAEFGPEHIATVYVPAKPGKRSKPAKAALPGRRVQSARPGKKKRKS
jgi:hypothetical protein